MAADDATLEVLRAIERRVLWLSTAIIDTRTACGPTPRAQGRRTSGVGGVDGLHHDHPVVRHLDRGTGSRSSPTPHPPSTRSTTCSASWTHPIPRLRELDGLQSYPSRTKDPDPVDYSTGSVGIGATAPIWGALSRRYLETALRPRDRAAVLPRRRCRIGRGRLWEAVLDPVVAGLGEVVWIVDLNSQSLDRVVPDIGARKLQGMFAAAGWQVLTVKYGRASTTSSPEPGGAALRVRIDAMSNPEYQRLLRCTAGGACPLARRRSDAEPSRARRDGLNDALRRGGPQPRRPRPHRPERCLRRDRRHPTHGDLRLHHQGIRPGHGATPRTIPRCSTSGRWRAGRAGGRRSGSHGDVRREAEAEFAPPLPRLRRHGPGAHPPPAMPADLGRTPTGTGHHPGRARPYLAGPDPRRRRRPQAGS